MKHTTQSVLDDFYAGLNEGDTIEHGLINGLLRHEELSGRLGMALQRRGLSIKSGVGADTLVRWEMKKAYCMICKSEYDLADSHDCLESKK